MIRYSYVALIIHVGTVILLELIALGNRKESERLTG